MVREELYMTNYPYPNMNQPGAQPPWGGQPQQNAEPDRKSVV